MEDIERLIRRELSECEPEILAAYVFGSAARGEATPSSDIDVAILLATGISARLDGLPFTLWARLDRVLLREVDVVVLNGSSPDLVHRVLRDGRLLLDRNPAERIRFEVWARNVYFDMQPLRRRYCNREAAAL